MIILKEYRKWKQVTFLYQIVYLVHTDRMKKSNMVSLGYAYFVQRTISNLMLGIINVHLVNPVSKTWWNPHLTGKLSQKWSSVERMSKNYNTTDKLPNSTPMLLNGCIRKLKLRNSILVKNVSILFDEMFSFLITMVLCQYCSLR